MGIAVEVGLGSQSLFPLGASGDGRYLTTPNGTPFLLVGDSPQGLIAAISTTDAETYFANRAGYGVNFVQCHLLCGFTFGGGSYFATYDSITPFTTNYDVSTPREAYFARVDAMLALAAKYNITVMLNAAETIEVLATFKDNGTSKCYGFGQYLGERYKNTPNLIWCYGNDFQTWDVVADNEVILAVCDGIKNKDSNHLHTAWLDYHYSTSRDSADWDSRVDVSLGYTYYPTYSVIFEGFADTPAKPIFLGESNYEGESLMGYETTAFVIRKQMWWAMTSGACGHVYCNEDIWSFASGWASRLDSYEGLADVPHLTALCNAYQWWTWVSDESHTILTAGYGTKVVGADGSINTNDYVSACKNADASFFVAYIPTQREVTLNMAQLHGSNSLCRWYHPGTGAWTTIGTYSNSGTRNFTPPDTNDWALVTTEA